MLRTCVMGCLRAGGGSGQVGAPQLPACCQQLASSRRVADRLDVVAIRIKNERAVIMFVIMRPQARLAVVAATCSERGLVERIDIGPGLGRKRDVEASPQHAFAVADPEI